MDDAVMTKYNDNIRKLEALKLKYATKMTQVTPNKESIVDAGKIKTPNINYAAKVIACELVLTRMRPKPQKKPAIDPFSQYDETDLLAYSGFGCQYCAGPGPQKYSCACRLVQEGYYNYKSDEEDDEYV